jgi:hypothetical protein
MNVSQKCDGFSKFAVSVSKYVTTAAGKLLYITCQELNIGVELNHLWIEVETVLKMCFKQRAVHSFSAYLEPQR